MLLVKLLCNRTTFNFQTKFRIQLYVYINIYLPEEAEKIAYTDVKIFEAGGRIRDFDKQQGEKENS